MKVIYAALMERSIEYNADMALQSVIEHSARCGYSRLALGYNRTDVARNLIVKTFLENTISPDDTLVMLDCDHAHPADVVQRLAAHSVDVVGALYFNKLTLEPMFFVRDNGKRVRARHWSQRLTPCVCVGTGAIAIKRRVFEKLDAAGFRFPYFRYTYIDGSAAFMTEDVYFGDCCEKAGIQHYVDPTLESPHLTTVGIDGEVWKAKRGKR